MKRPTKLDIARELIAKFPRHSQRQLGRTLMAKHPLLFASDEAARTIIRRASGSHAMGSRAKKGRGVKGQKIWKTVNDAPHAMPASQAKPWQAFALEGRRILVLSDVHVPFHDGEAIGLAVEWGAKRFPDVVLLNGDIADFHGVSRFETNPEERDFSGELSAVRQFLRFIRVKFKRSRIIYKLGNHEERWFGWLWRRAPELMGCDFADFAEMTQASELGIEVVSDQRIIMVGKLPILHGHEWRAGISTPVNPARGAFLKAIECALQGHLHRTSEHTETSLLGRTLTCWSTGCLCDLHPEYARVNRWNHGFAEIEMHNGDFNVENKRILRGKVF